MSNTVFLGKNNYIEQVYAGNQTEEALMSSVKQVHKLATELSKKGIPVNILVDITDLGRLSTTSRKAIVQALKDIPYDRIAAYGGSAFNKALASLIITTAGKRNTIKLFVARKEARRWLAQSAMTN